MKSSFDPMVLGGYLFAVALVFASAPVPTPAQASDGKQAAPPTPTPGPASSPTPVAVKLQVDYGGTVTVSSPVPTFTPKALSNGAQTGLTAARVASATLDANGITIRFVTANGPALSEALALPASAPRTIPTSAPKAQTTKSGRGFPFGSKAPSDPLKTLLALTTSDSQRRATQQIFVVRLFARDGTSSEGAAPTPGTSEAPYITVQVDRNQACFVYGNRASGVHRDQSDADQCTAALDNADSPTS